MIDSVPFGSLLSKIIDNRGKTCPTSEDGIPLIATNCIKNEHLYPVYEKVRYVSQEIYDTWFRGHPEPGDLIFVLKGTPGRVNWVNDPVDFCIAQDMVALRVDESKVYPKYLFAVLRSSQIQQEIEGLHVGSLIPHFKKSDFDDLQIPLVEQKLQKYIGDTYFNLSLKIDLLHRQNKTLEAMAETLFRQWFIEEAKEEWGEIPFGYLIELHDSKRIPLSQLQRDERRLGALYPYYGASGIIDQINEYIFDGDYLLLSEDGENLRTRKTPIAFEAKGKFWVNNHAHVMQAKPPFTNGFLRILLEGENLDSIITGAVQPKINQANLVSYKIPNFPHELVIKYVGLSNPWFCKVHSNAKQIQTLENLRDTLLPKLMSGEVRVQYQTEEVA